MGKDESGTAKGDGKPMQWLKRVAPLLSLVIFVVALALLHHLLQRIHVTDVLASLRRTPRRSLLSALFLTAASYLSLAGFDGLGASYIGRKLPAAWIVLISFVSHAVSHSTGFATLTGGAIRYRMYSAVGLSAADVAAVVAFCGLTFGLGACFLAALALLAEPDLLSTVLHLPAVLLRLLGAVLALGVCSYVGWAIASPRPLRLFRRSFPVPRPQVAILQIGVAATDLALASAALFVLLPEGTRPGYPAFLGAYVVANLLGLLAHVPGGLGVFDAAILVLTPAAPPDATLGALLLFRGIYNLLPLALAAILLLLYEVLEKLPGVGRRIGGLFDELGPPLLSTLVLAAGALTAYAHAVPDQVPMPLHAQVMGIAEAAAASLLMVLARGLNRRNRLARLGCLGCLMLLAALVMAQEPFAPRALVLGLLAVILALSGGLSEAGSGPPPPLTAPWTLAIGAILGGACWLTWWDGRSQLLTLAVLRPPVMADAAALLVFITAWALGQRQLRGRGPI